MAAGWQVLKPSQVSWKILSNGYEPPEGKKRGRTKHVVILYRISLLVSNSIP
jgi:hypothetical protein